MVGHTEMTGCSTLTHAVICVSGNSQKMQTSRDALINVMILPEISHRNLLKRMRKKFNSLDEKLNEAQDCVNEVAHIMSEEVEALA